MRAACRRIARRMVQVRQRQNLYSLARPFSSDSTESDGDIVRLDYEIVKRFKQELLKRQPLGSVEDDTDSEEEAEEETEVEEPWKNLLAAPARASWRVTSDIPDPIRSALSEMLKGKKRKNVEIILEQIIEQHKQLVDRRTRERNRLLANREYSSHEKKKDEGIQSIKYGPEETMTHAYFRFVPYWAVTKRVLSEASSLLGNSWKPRNVLDFGLGCGSAVVAAHDVFGENIEWIHGIDPSETMRESTQYILGEILKDVSRKPQVTYSGYLEAATKSTGTFDLALFTYTAMEFTQNASTMAAAAMLWEKLADNGIFVMIEPGTPDGFRSIRSVRSMLLDCCRDECHIVAPCMHQGRCPMESFQVNNAVYKKAKGPANDDSTVDVTRSGFCSFVQTMPPSGDRKKEEKFSYLVMQKRVSADMSSPQPFNETCVSDLLRKTWRATEDSSTQEETKESLKQQAVELERRYMESKESDPLGLQLLASEERRKQFGRILHAPIKRRGHILVDCCVSPGAVVRNKIPKSVSKRLPGIYAASRKARWGGMWPILPYIEEKVN